MHSQNQNYSSYLLRIWRDTSEREWRATLQDVFSGDSYHFATLFELYANLQEITSGNNGRDSLDSAIEFRIAQILESAD